MEGQQARNSDSRNNLRGDPGRKKKGKEEESTKERRGKVIAWESCMVGQRSRTGGQQGVDLKLKKDLWEVPEKIPYSAG